MNNWDRTLGTGVALAGEHLGLEGQEGEGGLFLLGPLLPRACQSPNSLFNSRLSSLILSFLFDVEWHDGAAVTVVAASKGYPKKYPKEMKITGLEKIPTLLGGDKNKLGFFHVFSSQVWFPFC